MFEKLDECPSCGYPKFTNHLICTDHSISGDSFALVKCAKCELVFTNPRPTQESIGVYYEGDQYISHSNKSTSSINFVYKIVRQYTLQQKFKLLKSLNPDQKQLLDYGSGTGHFMKFIQTKGWRVAGVEPNSNARLIGEKRTKITIPEKIEDVHGEFDMITAWHVIEHVHDLDQTIKALRKRLSPSGHMVIAVPNPNSYDAQHYKSAWAAYDVPRHLYHFTQKSFEAFVNGRKLKIKKIIPMKFDAFYVSLLSEKYLKGSNNYIQAMKIALKSNRMAKKNSEYSSLIYILKK